MDKTFIIAEAGVNHNGCIKTAKQLIELAVSVGADAVKFQTFNAEKLVVPKLQKLKYQIENTRTGESQLEMLKRLELSKQEHQELFDYCKKKGIVFMSTPFDEESVDLLDDLGMGIFKIPSGEITNKLFIQHIATKHKPIILSTGMSYLHEVEKAISWISQTWQGISKKPQLTLLHCVSDYPTAAEDVNLLAINTLKSRFGLPVGYSDHTLGIEIALAAVALGAAVIEKHFTLDKNMSGPDHKVSLSPNELLIMVKAIRNIELAIGNGVKIPVNSELNLRKVVRRSIRAARDIKAGEILNRKDISLKRPGTGLSSDFIESILGKKINVDVKKDFPIQESYFQDS